MRNKTKVALIVVVLIGFGLAALVGYYVFSLRLIYVPSGSMANTIIPGDSLVVKVRVKEIIRGDIVLFQSPPMPSEMHLGRVVGLPREKIEIRDKLIYIDGQELQEHRVTVVQDRAPRDALPEISSEGSGPYSVFYSQREPGDEPPPMPNKSYGIDSPFEIPEGHYFVMGDNRDNSFDSRFWGTLPRAAIFGKTTMIYWSSQVDQSGTEEGRLERVFRRIK